jgi:predicted outer membrane repeat protein
MPLALIAEANTFQGETLASRFIVISVAAIVILATVSVVVMATLPNPESPKATATVVYVATNGNDRNDGLSPNTAKLTINAAVQVIPSAPGSGTVRIAQGVYSGDGNRNITISNKYIAITGAGSNLTAIELGGVSWAFEVIGGNVAFSDLAINNGAGIPFVSGKTQLMGGAIINSGTASLARCGFSFNGRPPQTQNGGVIFNTGAMTIADTFFYDNHAVKGAGIYNEGALSITNSSFTSNSAIVNWMPEEQGGAIYSTGDLVVTKSTFNSNRAMNGGAVYNMNNMTIDGCSFTGNHATMPQYTKTMKLFGGAIFTNGYSWVMNSAFTSNEAEFGGAINNDQGISIDNCSFTNNSAAESGGALFINGYTLLSDSMFLHNNAALNGGAIVVSEGLTDIEACDFVANHAGNMAGALDVLPLFPNVNIHFCRLLNNTDDPYYKGDQIFSEGSIDASFNWWGTNTPDLDYWAHSQYGKVTKEPYLVLRTDFIYNYATDLGTMVTSLCYDSLGVYHDPSIMHVPDTSLAQYYADWGTVNATTSVFVNGETSVGFAGDPIQGYGDYFITVDMQTNWFEVVH